MQGYLIYLGDRPPIKLVQMLVDTAIALGYDENKSAWRKSYGTCNGGLHLTPRKYIVQSSVEWYHSNIANKFDSHIVLDYRPFVTRILTNHPEIKRCTHS